MLLIQIKFFLIFAGIVAGGWLFMKLIQKIY